MRLRNSSKVVLWRKEVFCKKRALTFFFWLISFKLLKIAPKYISRVLNELIFFILLVRGSSFYLIKAIESDYSCWTLKKFKRGMAHF